MLQRIQTVFMFLALVAGILIFFFPVANYISDTNYLTFFIHTIKDMVPDPFAESSTRAGQFGQWFTLPLAAGQFVIIVLLFLTIFQFKKRVLQIRLNLLNIFLNVLLGGGIYFYIITISNITGLHPEFGNVLEIPLILAFPIIVIILLFVANFYIRKDEKLIRSSNRLR